MPSAPSCSDAATKVVEANGGKIAGRGAGPAVDRRLLLLPAAGAGLGRAGARAGQRRRRLHQLAEGGQEFGITKTMKPAALLAFISDIHGLGLKTAQGLYSDHRLVLGPQPRDARLRQALLRDDEERADDEPGGLLLGDDALPEGGQGRRHHRPGQGDGRAEEDEDQRLVRQGRLHPRRRPDGPQSCT